MDNEFEIYTLKDWSISGNNVILNFKEGSSMMSEFPHGFNFKEGQEVKLYGKGFGFPVRGIEIEGTKFYYRTPSEQEDHMSAMVKERKDESLRDYESKKDYYNEVYSELHPTLQKRIDHFKEKNESPEHEWLPYEIFIYEQPRYFKL